jgi:anti-anti-sigma regulatory factor
VLKITITETQTESRWILQGRLVGPWVRELRLCWKKKHRAQSSQRCVVDLNDVTFIDKAGERLLRAMAKKGAELIASGMYTNHLLEKVKATVKGSLFRLLICLFAAVLVTASIPTDCVQLRPTLAKTNAKRSLDPWDERKRSIAPKQIRSYECEGGISCAENS